MNIIQRVKGWLDMIFKTTAEKEYKVTAQESNELQTLLDKCGKIYQGHPPWLSKKDHIDTINFAKSIASEIGRLTTMGISIQIDGGSIASRLQEQIENEYFNLRTWCEYAAAYGTIIMKPNGKDIDILTPADFIIIESDNHDITDIIFIDHEKDGEKYYTLLERHRIEETYTITNIAYVSDRDGDIGRKTTLDNSPWNNLEDETTLEGVEKPLFGVIRMPNANNIDLDSPLGLPCFAEALQELKDLDTAYSRNSKEIFDSKRTVLLDSDKLMESGAPVRRTLSGFEDARKEMGLPDYVKNVYSGSQEDFYQEINPTLNTEERLKGLNALLSQIGFKCGFSNGYFVFNEKTGMVTATQVESDDRRTIQLIKDVRDQLESCLDGLIYALYVFSVLYDGAPAGEYEIFYDFGDITYNREEDRARWYSYVTSGKMAFWRYLVKFEGFTEEEAKEVEEEMKQKESLFGGVEE